MAGNQLIAGGFSGQQLALLFGVPENYEKEELGAFVQKLPLTRRFVDIGANHGLYSYVANHVISDADIILIEANPRLCENLRSAIESYPAANKNRIQIHNYGASDKNGTMMFTLGEQDTLGTLAMKGNRNTNNQITVQTKRIDDLITPLPHTVFKIDVEGFEWRVLRGAMKNIRSAQCSVFAELHGWGDAELGKYPFHVLLLMFLNGFGVKRIGSSYQYLFESASLFRRALTLFRCAPLHFAKYIARQMGIRPYYYMVRSKFARANTVE